MKVCWPRTLLIVPLNYIAVAGDPLGTREYGLPFRAYRWAGRGDDHDDAVAALERG